MGPITSDTWKILSSRPIRGAENDPMRAPSKALLGLLKLMLLEFKDKFPPCFFGQESTFPVLAGCDDYINRISKVNLSGEIFTKTTLITADFGDAYTETSIPGLQKSISVIGNIFGYGNEYITLMQKMVKLVFTNCVFYTPTGLYRQTKGMPMGDFSSRDSLDIVLTRSELNIINFSRSIPLGIHLFCRLVDDISVLCQGDFEQVRILISTIARNYPNMPLNFQISFGYSRFLDLHIYNFVTFFLPTYRLYHS